MMSAIGEVGAFLARETAASSALTEQTVAAPTTNGATVTVGGPQTAR